MKTQWLSNVIKRTNKNTENQKNETVILENQVNIENKIETLQKEKKKN